ncbi:MAG: GMC family oxidoreductase N-terminal domain-containing protein [Sandaracinaceae bacterium]|nr:GMC family oxidoreductase N-terminal domain-containing protein [Sandaracinaceae bacterium]
MRRRPGVNRRTFLAVGSVATGGVALSQWGCGGPTDRVIELDHPLIIGTGFGGSISAHRLTEAGHRVTVLERGRRWDISPTHDTFCSLRDPDRRAAWLSSRTHIGLRSPVDRYIGMIEEFRGVNIDVAIGAGVGGGSLAYAGMMVKPPQDLFERIFPAALSYAEMDATWYPRMQSVMPMRTVPDSLFEHDNYTASRIFVDHAMRAGLTPERNLSAIDWDLIEAELRGEFPEEGSVGDYIYGLNSGAKGSTDRSYLRLAEESGLCEVLPQHQVAAVGMYPDGSFRADVEIIDEVGMVMERVVFHAPKLILSAGSIHSTRLLVEAKARGWMPDLPAALGTGWGNNGQHIHMRGGLDEDVGVVQGGPPCVVIRDLSNPISPITVEHGAAAFGYDCHCLINPSSAMISGTGQMVWDATEMAVRLEWTTEMNSAADMAALDVGARLTTAAGGEVQVLPGGRTRPQTFHPLGGVPMGAAADTFGRVNGHEGLYVIDGALIPGCTPTSNPAWTIGAIAERALDTIVREDFA